MCVCVCLGPTSFEELLTVGGQRCETFKMACNTRGLLEDDNEWKTCLTEAALMATGNQLRSLFVCILRDCHPASPELLWEQFKVSLCDDIHHHLQRHFNIPEPTEEQVFDYGLFRLDLLLQQSNRSLKEFHGMPLSHLPWAVAQDNHLIAEQLDFDPNAMSHQSGLALQSMNAGQRAAYDAILSSVTNSQGRLFFLHGPAGTGKTFTYKALCYALRAQSKIVLCVASSGIAALLLPGGRTSHSRFKIPLEIDSQSICYFTKQSDLTALLHVADLIVWDEAPMQHKHCSEAVSRTLSKYLQPNGEGEQLFGGKTVVFGGDFQQILPVIPKGSRAEIVSACLRKSWLWPSISPLFLTANMRLGQSVEDREFATWLQEMGHGRHTDADGNIHLPNHMKCHDNTPESLIQSIYPNITIPGTLTHEYLLSRIILSARNDDVDELNTTVLDKMPGEKITFLSADSIQAQEGEEFDETEYTTEFLSTITLSGMPLAKLDLKVGCPIIILRNMDAANGVCNGTRAVLTHASTRVLQVVLLGGDFAGRTAFIPRIDLTPSDSPLPFRLTRRQFPVRLAFAMTINKAQGQSVSNVGLDLRTPVFTHGQLYVALSRVTSALAIKVIFHAESQGTHTKNVVYPEVLLDAPQQLL